MGSAPGCTPLPHPTPFRSVFSLRPIFASAPAARPVACNRRRRERFAGSFNGEAAITIDGKRTRLHPPPPPDPFPIGFFPPSHFRQRTGGKAGGLQQAATGKVCGFVQRGVSHNHRWEAHPAAPPSPTRPLSDRFFPPVPFSPAHRRQGRWPATGGDGKGLRVRSTGSQP